MSFPRPPKIETALTPRQTAPSEGPEAQPQAGFARHAQHVAAAHEALKAAPRPDSIRKEAVARTSTETPALPGGRDAPDQGGLYAPQAAAGASRAITKRY